MEALSNITEEQNFTLNSRSLKFLEEGAKWAKFLSIVGFVAIAFLVVLAAVMFLVLPQLNSSELADLQGMEDLPNGSAFGAVLGPVLGFLYLIIAVIYFIPVWFLFQFSNKSIQAIKEKNEIYLENAFNQLRKHYKFIGILTIIALALYAIIFIGGFLGGLMGAML